MASSDFLLSSFTQAVWLEKGGVQLTRIKSEEEDFDGGYRIFVPYQTCRAIVCKQKLIIDTMAAIKDGIVESPCNINLYKQQVLRLSEFMDYFYFGIHSLGSNDRPRIGKGMNLSEIEFEELLTKLTTRFALQQEEKTKKKKQKYGEEVEQNADGEGGPLKKRKYRVDETIASTSSCSVNQLDETNETTTPQFWVTKYGWTWYSDVGGQYISTKKAEGKWHYDPKSCFYESMSAKPQDNSQDENLGGKDKLDVFHLKELVIINNDFLDAALAKLIKFNVDCCVQEDKALYLHDSQWENIEIYGKTVLDRIETTDIYDLCKKVMSHYCTITPSVELALMKICGDYIKDEAIISAIRDETINGDFLALLDYMYTN